LRGTRTGSLFSAGWNATCVTMIGSGKSIIAAGADRPGIADYIALLKPRVMSLVGFTGFVGL
jgi:hypothetical protein